MDRTRERTLRKRVVVLAGLVTVAVVAGACSGEPTHVTASSTPLAGVSVETRLRLEGDVLLRTYQVANHRPSSVLVVTDRSRSRVHMGDDGVLEVSRALRAPLEGIVFAAVPTADTMEIPPGESFGEELPLHHGRGPLETVDGPIPFADITGARSCVGLIPDHGVRSYERKGRIVTVFEDEEAIAAQRVMCSEVVPLRINTDGYLAPPR